ncbi:hypothetical protein [Pannonibacter sp. I15F10I1]|uniref:hypothetical protein n=1 Tax=Pannonibacter sp. I15F10I1 TaxID=2003580 RepID=UPI00164511AC|nr:hypothetical protein [Pannonibacter sp. I15F10I1]
MQLRAAILSITAALPLLCTPATAQVSDSQLIGMMGLTDVSVKDKQMQHGRELRGRLADGTWIEAEFRSNGELEEIESKNGGFPIASVSALLPDAVKANPSFPHGATLRKLEFGSKIEMEGRTAEGRKFEAEFSSDGTLLEFDLD